MNVLFTSPALFGADGVYGGGERYATELARAVAGETGAATLYGAGSRDAEWHDGALRVVMRKPWLRVRGQRFNPLPRGLWSLLHDADVVHCFQQHIVMTTLSAALARLRRIPCFATDLGGGGWDLSAYVDTSNWFAGLLHLSHYAAHVLGRGADPRDAVLYGGVGAAMARGGGDDGSVLFVGRLFPHKGPDVLVEAAEPDWPVVICGKPYDERYHGDLRTLAAGKRISFAQDVDDAGLAALYERAAVVVVPSRGVDRYGNSTPIAELLGLVALEAMAYGIPVVASREASLPELVVDGVTGLLVPPGDVGAMREAVGSLLASPGRRLMLGAAAQRRATERFGWATAARTAVAAYARAVAS